MALTSPRKTCNCWAGVREELGLRVALAVPGEGLAASGRPWQLGGMERPAPAGLEEEATAWALAVPSAIGHERAASRKRRSNDRLMFIALRPSGKGWSRRSD